MSLAPLAEAADHVVLVQWVLRNLAHREGLQCRFDPLLRRGHAGSGLHVHLSPVRDGQHLARRDADGRLSNPAQWLIAGLVRHGAALMAFGNRVEGSFLRLSQGKESPTAVGWGEADRHALVRLPITAHAADGREVAPPTIEFRLPDGSAHPHLLLAGVAQALISGRATPDLAALLDATRSGVVHVGASSVPSLPTCAREVGDALHAQRRVLEAGGVFPEAFVERVVAGLR
jgi:glutamine synthetase